MKTYPIFLTGLENKHCIVIGGGHEGEGKVRGLLEVDAIVTVISPELTATLHEWAEAGHFTWLQRPYQPGDLRGAFLVIAERTDAETNGRIHAEAEAEGALVNVMDDVAHCNFVAGSVVRRGLLTLVISTSGAAPALAVRLRQRFEQEFDAAYAEFLALMQALRPSMFARYARFGQRKERYYRLVDSDVLELLRNGRRAEARQRIAEITGIDLPPEGE